MQKVRQEMILKETASRFWFKSYILGGICFSVIILLLFSSPFRNRQPTYDGQTLDYWLAWSAWATNENSREWANKAIRSIGTNALPVLLKKITYRESNFGSTLRETVSRLAQQYLGVQVKMRNPREERSLGWAGFQALGPLARPAIPQLTELFHDPATAYSGAIALYYMGVETFPIFTNALASTNALVRAQAAACLGFIGKDGWPVELVWETIPILEKLTVDPDPIVRRDASYSLVEIGVTKGIIESSEKIMACLICSLSDPAEEVRYPIAAGMNRFGEYGQAAIPHLERLTNDPSSRVREHAKSSLEKIRSAISSTNEPVNVHGQK